jgi:hypothetical protein
MKRSLVQIRMIDGRFHVTDTDEAVDAAYQAALRPLVERECRRAEQYVEHGGRIVRTVVYLRDGEGDGYAELGPDGFPIAAEEPALSASHPWPDMIDQGLLARVGTSEAITADTAVAIDRHFIEPNLCWDTDSGPEPACWDEIRRPARLVVLGPAGSGKTTLLRRIAHEYAEQAVHDREPTVPIYSRLRDVRPADLGDDLTALVTTADEGLHRLLSNGSRQPRILLILDGLDEIPDIGHRRQVLNLITKVCVDRPTVQVVLASREAAYRDRLSGFAHVRVEPFDGPRVALWSRRYLTSVAGPEAWRAFTTVLAVAPDLASLAANPLLVSVFANMFAAHDAAGVGRAHVVDRCAEALLTGWDTVRGVRRGVDARQMRWALREMALAATRRDRSSFQTDDLALHAAEQVGTRADPAEVLGICADGGILTERSGQWSFTHEILQDLFTARRLLDNGGFTFDEDLGPRWLRAWELACALVGDATALIEAAVTHLPEKPLISATWLATGIGQEIRADRRTVGRACTIIRESLERHAGLLGEVSPAERQSLGTTWAIAVADDQAGNEMHAVIGAVHRARHGSAASMLRQVLAGSPDSLVAHIAQAMRLDGEVMTVDGSENAPCLVYLAPALLSGREQPARTPSGSLQPGWAARAGRFTFDKPVEVSRRGPGPRDMREAAAALREAIAPYMDAAREEVSRERLTRRLREADRSEDEEKRTRRP